jgi:hypothetical protein
LDFQAKGRAGLPTKGKSGSFILLLVNLGHPGKGPDCSKQIIVRGLYRFSLFSSIPEKERGFYGKQVF